MRNFQDTFEISERSLISTFLIYVTVPLKSRKKDAHTGLIILTSKVQETSPGSYGAYQLISFLNLSNPATTILYQGVLYLHVCIIHPLR